MPGQREFLSVGQGTSKPYVPMAPIFWTLAKWFQDKEMQFLADQIDLNAERDWGAWSFLRVLTLHKELSPYWNDNMSVEYFKEAGVWTARHGRRSSSSQLTFVCGNPLGYSVYRKAVEGYPHVTLDYGAPAQGSFSWFCQGRHVMTLPDGRSRQKTQNYNTLLVNSEGQVFEGYPQVRPQRAC